MNNTISSHQFFSVLFLVFMVSFSFGVIAGAHVEESLLFKNTYGKEFVIVGKNISTGKVIEYRVKDKDGNTFEFNSDDSLEINDVLTMRKK